MPSSLLWQEKVLVHLLGLFFASARAERDSVGRRMPRRRHDEHARMLMHHLACQRILPATPASRSYPCCTAVCILVSSERHVEKCLEQFQCGVSSASTRLAGGRGQRRHAPHWHKLETDLVADLHPDTKYLAYGRHVKANGNTQWYNVRFGKSCYRSLLDLLGLRSEPLCLT